MTEANPLAPEQITRLREALKPFADLAEHDTSESDHDLDIWRPSGFTKCPNINVGHLRAAHAALFASPAPSGQGALERYDAGLLGDGGDGDVEWWQNYLRAELERAHDFYADQWENRS